MFTTELSPQNLLQALPRARDRGVTAERLAEAFNLDEAQKARLDEYLSLFVSASLAAVKGGRYWRKKNDHLLIGTLRLTRTGYGFIVPADEREKRRGDLFVGEADRGTAMHGDIVIARLTGQDARGREGRVEAVLNRANQTVVGKFFQTQRTAFVVPLDDRLQTEIDVDRSATLAARHGDIVHVEITHPPTLKRLPRGRIIEVLGDDSTPGIDIEIIIRKHRIPYQFSDAVLREAEAIADTIDEEEIARRADLRSWLMVTIDGETARDFDDAVSLEVLPSGRFRLGVHIADVSHYVREGGAIDAEAFRRGTSVYFPERAIHMLPERLSANICSLKPRQQRLAMSAIIELDQNGRVVTYRLTPAVIYSRERLTYTAVNEILTDPEGETARQYAHVKPMLLQMRDLALILIRLREQRGAIDFNLPEAELFFNDEGTIGGIVRSQRNLAHRLIEEFMLLANETVATHLERLPVPTLYRVHDEPNPQKVEEFADIAASFGHAFSMHGPIPQYGFQHLAKAIEGKPEERMVSFLMLRSMQRAKYSAKNTGHFGLAMKTYTHFTSPIRRYPDLIVHRLLREVLEKGRRGDQDWQQIDLGDKSALKQVSWDVFAEERVTQLRQELSVIAEQSSQRERAADEAERELMDWRKADFMAEHVGEEFDGVITSVKEFGFYVELNEFFIEGLVHLSTLVDDIYEYSERRHRLVGRRQRRKLQLGDSVRVAVVKVDRERHLIDFALVSP